MTQRTILNRFFRLSRSRRTALIRASITVTVASAAVATLPFRRAIAFGSPPLRDRLGLSEEECVWAVEAAAKLLPWRTMCIEKGIAVQRLLRQSGIEAVLHYGARHRPAELEAHVWVTVAGESAIGGDEAEGFVELARYP